MDHRVGRGLQEVPIRPGQAGTEGVGGLYDAMPETDMGYKRSVRNNVDMVVMVFSYRVFYSGLAPCLA